MNKRQEILKVLIGFEQPIQHLEDMLSKFDWDSDKELVLLSLAHIAHVLKNYLAADISADEVEQWANAIECRDDIGFESHDEDLIRDLIHELADPLVTEPLIMNRAEELLRRIGEAFG